MERRQLPSLQLQLHERQHRDRIAPTPLRADNTLFTDRLHLRTHIVMAPVTFWSAPRQYITWAARHKPAILWSLVIGSFGPLFVVRKEHGRREEESCLEQR